MGEEETAKIKDAGNFRSVTSYFGSVNFAN